MAPRSSSIRNQGIDSKSHWSEDRVYLWMRMRWWQLGSSSLLSIDSSLVELILDTRISFAMVQLSYCLQTTCHHFANLKRRVFRSTTADNRSITLPQHWGNSRATNRRSLVTFDIWSSLYCTWWIRQSMHPLEKRHTKNVTNSSDRSGLFASLFLLAETNVSKRCRIPNRGKRKTAAFTAFLNTVQGEGMKRRKPINDVWTWRNWRSLKFGFS